MLVQPDIGAAIMLYLKDCTELNPILGSGRSMRVVLEWPKAPNNFVVPDSEGKFLNCIMVETGKGGPGAVGSSLIKERIDLKYYGANRKTANDLFRVGNSYLIPVNERTKTSFIRANCRVYQIEVEGTGLRLTDPDASNWPYTLGSYIVTYSGVPVS